MSALRIRPTGLPKSRKPRTSLIASSLSGVLMSARTTVVEASSASSARPCRNTLGSLSTYTTRAERFIVCAIWCVFCTVGRPEPRSRNWVTPWATMYLTARPSAARFIRAPLPSSPMAFMASMATIRSTSKLSLPPRIASYTRATLGFVVSISGRT